MKKFLYLLILTSLMLVLAACNQATDAASTGPGAPAAYPPAAGQTAGEAYPSAASEVPADPWSAEAYPAADSQSPAAGSTNCASAEANELGASIAADYPNLTTTEQVMSWFCAGAEYEDILVALETADQTGADAKEMLAMLAAGLSWEEIWQVVGLTGQP